MTRTIKTRSEAAFMLATRTGDLAGYAYSRPAAEARVRSRASRAAMFAPIEGGRATFEVPECRCCGKLGITGACIECELAERRASA